MAHTKRWWICISFFVFFGTPISALSTYDLYQHGNGIDQLLPAGDEEFAEAQLRVPIVFYGESHNTIFVNNNGLLSFRTEIPSFLNVPFPLDYPVIAPLYTNVDTQASGYVAFRETQDPETLHKLTGAIQGSFSYASGFTATSAFIATWSNVGYHRHGSDKTNTYQVAIATNGNDSYVEILYPSGGIQWIQGSENEAGLPDARAQAGILSDDGRMLTLPGSGTDQISNIDKLSNVDSPGVWLFHVGQLSPEENVHQPDRNRRDSTVPASSCLTGSTQCHSQARCVDFENGFCCVCKEGFYGNGKTCLKLNNPFRVNGKVNGHVNGQSLTQLDLQSYVVMSDGRAYTAISKMPEVVGYSFQTLHIIGGVLSWLFSKPIGDAKNGYQITGGVLNHTATITFPKTGDKVTVWNRYSGLDVYDQLRLEVEVAGSIPVLPYGTKISVPEYVEEFTVTGPGIIQSQSSHHLKLGPSGDQIPYSIQQSFSYIPCQYADPLNITSFKVKVTKSFIGYESREKIIRFGASSKSTPLSEEDPCLIGSTTCVENSYCLVEGDSFRCVCHPGYHQIYDGTNILCVDINECTTGSHYCDRNARCQNEEGSFSCTCNEGFSGDGRTCEREENCGGRCSEDGACVVNQEGYLSCQCNPGYAGDGISCYRVQIRGCNETNYCSPYAKCSPSYQGYYDCVCLAGYSGDGRTCERDEPVETQTAETATEPTTTATTVVTEDRVLEKCLLGVCWCPDGHQKEENSNYCIRKVPTATRYDEEETALSCNIVNNCHPHAQCIFILSSERYQCQCNAGYEGDGLECSELDVSCKDVDICDENASCIDDTTLEKSICICNSGYQGDGQTCQAIMECTSTEECDANSECLYSGYTHKYECICNDGYAKDANHVCQPLTGSCGGGTCIENAQCLYDTDYQTYYCQCNSGYIGDGITECKLQPIGCNVQNNCGIHANCEYDLAVGAYQCKCDHGYYGDGFVCTTERTCEVDPYICDRYATCILDNLRRRVCSCNPGYTGNGTYCKLTPKHEGNFLLLNKGMATLRVPFNPTPKNLGKPIQIQYYQMAIGIDIDCYEGRVYWTDIAGTAQIKSAAYDGSSPSSFITEDIGSSEGLSVDWVSRNIYWVDSKKDTLEVANIDTKLRKVLIKDGLVNPRGIAVHPQRGKVFWSDWNREAPKIEWANLDGSQRQVFLDGPRVKLPNSLAIDWNTDHLCFADAGTKNIECINIETRVIQTIVTNCSYPFGLGISNDHFYWTDWISLQIENVDKATLTIQKPLDVPLGGSGSKLYGLVAVPDNCPPLYNACQYNNGQCSPGHLCLPNGHGGRTCACAASDLCNDV